MPSTKLVKPSADISSTTEGRASSHETRNSMSSLPPSSKPSRTTNSNHRRRMVIIQLPPQVQPPSYMPSSTPAHRTAPIPQPVLISASYPGRRHTRKSISPPNVTYHIPSHKKSDLSSSSTSSLGPSSPSPPSTHSPPAKKPNTDSGGSSSRVPPLSRKLHAAQSTTRVSSSAPRPLECSRSTSHDDPRRSTITPIVRRQQQQQQKLEDEYYSHPAVRAYEMQKAAEQAQWTRDRMMQRAAGSMMAGRSRNSTTTFSMGPGVSSEMRSLRVDTVVGPYGRW